MPTDDALAPRPPGPACGPPPQSDVRPRDTAVDAALLDPERQFLGCLLQLPASAACALLAGIDPDDLATPMSAFILELVIDVVASDRDPTPGLVLGHAVTTGRAGGEQQHAWLGHELITLYQAAPVPLTGKHYKALILEAAWRRALRTYATRLQQAAESSAADILATIYAERSAVDAVYSRYRAAAEPESWPAALSTLRTGSRPAA
ncbi:hypothetical protein [Amycolatopsis sp. RTGN1]|uniref:hypothetical protein n=1 Tax=Amycolatopsis ponsaeliensis TaxID=2992142 RepID=UPI002549CF65|nr:hypothetical protein [Amycolatopsis sp. RTGN1]